MSIFFRGLTSILLIIVLPYCSHAKRNFNRRPDLKSGLSIGSWRGEIVRADGNSIVFNFITQLRSGKIVIYIINGAERLEVNEVSEKGDSVFIRMPFFDSY